MGLDSTKMGRTRRKCDTDSRRFGSALTSGMIAIARRRSFSFLSRILRDTLGRSICIQNGGKIGQNGMEG